MTCFFKKYEHISAHVPHRESLFKASSVFHIRNLRRAWLYNVFVEPLSRSVFKGCFPRYEGLIGFDRKGRKKRFQPKCRMYEMGLTKCHTSILLNQLHNLFWRNAKSENIWPDCKCFIMNKYLWKSLHNFSTHQKPRAVKHLLCNV